MFQKVGLFKNLKFSAIAAVVFCIPIVIYVSSHDYSKSWLIYLGSFLFCGVITAFTLFFNQTRDGNADITQMIWASMITVTLGVILSVIICFLILVVMIPGYPFSESSDLVATGTPVNEVHGKLNGLGFRIFIGAFVINFFIGAFVGSLFPFYIKRDQTKKSGKLASANNT